MVTMSGTIPRTGAAWIDTMFEPRTITEADIIRRDADATIDGLLGAFDVYTYAGREQYVWVLSRHRDKHRHQAHVEVSLGCPTLATAHLDAADMFDEAIEEVTC